MLLAIAAFAVAASTPVINSIRIESRWGGLGTPSDKTYTIDTRRSPKAVERFAAAIAAAPVGRQAAMRDIATPEWLMQARQYEKNSYVPVCSAEAKRRFEERLADPAFARKLLDRHYRASWTDDNPSFFVDVTFHGGRKVHIESHAQHALMLPWSVGGVQTWNPELARAIAALLPADAERRLGDAMLATAILDEIQDALTYELDPLEEACIHKDIAAAVERVFEIVHIYHGSPGDFTAYVRRKDFPPNVVFTLVVRDSEKPGALAALDRTVQRIGAYIDLVRPYLAAHPQTQFALWYVDGDAEAELEDYDPRSGIVSHSRPVFPNRGVVDEP